MAAVLRPSSGTQQPPSSLSCRSLTNNTSTSRPCATSQQYQGIDSSQGSGHSRYWDISTTAAASQPSSPTSNTPTTSHSPTSSQEKRSSCSSHAATDHSQPKSPLRTLPPKLPLSVVQTGNQARPLIAKSRSTTFPHTAHLEHSSGPPEAFSVRTLETLHLTKRSPALRSSHGVDNAQGPPSALLSRSQSLRDTKQRLPASPRTVSQRGLRPLKLLALREDNIEPDSAISFTATNSTHDNIAVEPSAASTTSAVAPSQIPRPSRSLHTVNERPQSAGVLMASSTEEYFEGGDAQSGQPYVSSQNLGELAVERHSGEDVFLNLARDPTQRFSLQDRIERRRSHLTRPGQRHSLSVTALPPQTESSDRDSAYGPPSSFENNPRLYSRRPSQITTNGLNQYRDPSPGSSASGAGRLDPYKLRYSSSQRTPTSYAQKSPEATRNGARRPSLSDSPMSPQQRAQILRPSKLNTTYREYENFNTTESALDSGRNRALSSANADGTESVDSGPAPSTVWDELEDLKSRIRRIELTGKTPSTSGAAMQDAAGAANDRPRTATTTVTTISSSPKHAKVGGAKGRAPDATNPEENHDASTALHPLLHQALGRCKAVLSPDLNRIVEAVANEALELAAMTGSAGTQHAPYQSNAAQSVDRQLRRKADNMCRTITELCITLSADQSRPDTDDNSPTITQRMDETLRSRESAGYNTRAKTEEPRDPVTAFTYGTARRTSLDPEAASEIPRESHSRALSRIEARRYSLNVLAMNNNKHSSALNSPRDVRPSVEMDYHAQSTLPQQQQPHGGLSRFNRVSTSINQTRRRAEDDEQDVEFVARPLSRAMTDVAHAPLLQNRPASITRRSRQSYLPSREYSQQEMLPRESSALASPLAGQVGSNLRRVTGTQIPQPSSLLRGGAGDSRRFLDRSTPPVAYDGSVPASAEERRRRISSLGNQYPADQRKSAGWSIGSNLRQPGPALDTYGDVIE